MKEISRVMAGLPLLLLAVLPQPAQSQGVMEPVSHTNVISGNPLLLLAGWFNAEYEHKVTGNVTAGISGGWLELDDSDYTSVSGFLRFYPQEAAFTGFYLGGRTGLHKVTTGDESDTAFGIGVDVGYAWLLGPGRSFYVGLGIGATRLFSGDLGDASATIPSVRLINVGIAF
jgi:hypothetical protein